VPVRVLTQLEGMVSSANRFYPHEEKAPRIVVGDAGTFAVHMSEVFPKKCCSCKHRFRIFKFYLAYRLLNYVHGVFRI
jgi:hypothetical protein